MLSNAYFLAKFRFDTAEIEPAKNLQIFAQKIAYVATFRDVLANHARPPVDELGAARRPGVELRRLEVLRLLLLRAPRAPRAQRAQDPKR